MSAEATLSQGDIKDPNKTMTISDDVMIEISGRENKLNAFMDRLRPYGILEVVRTGCIAMVRSQSPDSNITTDGAAPDYHNVIHGKLT